MKYPLDIKPTFNETLLFWLERFLRYKLTTLSNHQVKESQKLAKIIYRLNIGTKSIKELSKLIKEARNIGLIGINTYYKPLEKLYYFLTDLELQSMQEIDEELIIDFLSSATAGLSDATKKNYRIAMINFFGYIDKNNEDDGKSKIFDIELKNWRGLRGKSGEKLPVYLTQEELKRFLEAIENFPFSERVAYRDKALIKLILYTGIRVGEALSIQLKDIYEEDGLYIIKVKGKGNKSRIVMLKSSHIKDDIKEWLKRRKCQGGLLFCNHKGTPLTQAYVSRVVSNILKFAGLKKEKSGAHMLRHSFATLLYQKSKDLVLVQEALGHASLNTSRIYTHFDKEKLQKAANIMDSIKE